MTRFTEFYNKQKNIIKSSIAKRLESSIPISEERDAFYKGELFKKYDIVESEGKQYTILEQASNYYHVVDSEGNLSRKFPKQLTKIGHCNISIVNEGQTVLHGYTVKSEEAKDFLIMNFFEEANDNDDVGILKQVKQLDEQMDSSYKAKDKMTVAKIIADAVGVPHDVVSTPENLVAAAIRKAKKDPKLVKNKEILSNMLQIAKEVGIKITDETFEVKEATDWSPGAKESIKKDKIQSLKNLIVSYQSKKNFKKVAELQKELDGLLKESEDLDEGIIKKTNTGLIHKGTKGYGNDPEPEDTSLDRLDKSKQGRADKNMEIFHKKAKPTKTGIGSVHEALEEGGLSRKTIDSYLEKSKESKPDTIHKTIKRFAGQERAQDRVHKDELEKMKTRLSLKELRTKLSEEKIKDGTVEETPEGEVLPNTLPHGHSMNPSNEIHRKQLIRKVRGDD